MQGNENSNRHNKKNNFVEEDIFRLEGLDCADCAAKLEERLESTEGIENVWLNFGAAKMTVRHTVGADKIKSEVEKAGYKARVRSGREIYEPRVLWRDKKVMLTFISGFFLVIALFLLLFYDISNRPVEFLFLASILSGGLYIARSAFYSIKSFSMDMNVLMCIAVLGAVAIGEWAEGATVIFLFSLGNTLQEYSMEKTRSSIRELMELSPQEANVKKENKEIMLPIEEINTGDIIVTKPGERIALDGNVVKGRSTVNQAPITGESIPVEKQPGTGVFAGSINEDGALEIEVTNGVNDTTLAKIIDMVEEAQNQRAPSQQFVDVFARYYTPSVIVLALCVAVFIPLITGAHFEPWLEKALILLVIACPCALVISTPVSIVSAIGSAARRGALIKSGACLEETGKLKVMAFDKTGTLTRGTPEVDEVVPVSGYNGAEVLKIAAGVEIHSQHPLARAVVRYAGKMGLSTLESNDFLNFSGKGARAFIEDEVFYTGNMRLFQELQVDTTKVQKTICSLQREGKTVILVGSDSVLIGVIALSDHARPESKYALQGLRDAGIDKVVMLTGDNEETARFMAAYIGVDEVKAGLLPGDKLGAIKDLEFRYGKTGMIGDGINDAPALAAANVGFAMGGAGTDTTLETADITLMADDLSKLPYAVKLSRQAVRVIKQNIAFSLLIKAIFMAGTFLGFTTLWMAIFADTGASLLVIANGMRLMKVKE